MYNTDTYEVFHAHHQSEASRTKLVQGVGGLQEWARLRNFSETRKVLDRSGVEIEPARAKGKSHEGADKLTTSKFERRMVGK